jgi:hypothetical protein
MNFSDQFRASYTAASEAHRVRREAFLARMKASEQLKNAIETVVLFRNRLRSRRDARKRMKIRIQALASVRKTLEQAETMRAQNIQTVFNVALYLLQLDQDLAYFTTDMVQAVGDRRRAFVAKHEAVLLYEAAEDVPQLLGLGGHLKTGQWWTGQNRPTDQPLGTRQRKVLRSCLALVQKENTSPGLTVSGRSVAVGDAEAGPRVLNVRKLIVRTWQSLTFVVLTTDQGVDHLRFAFSSNSSFSSIATTSGNSPRCTNRRRPSLSIT